MAAAATTAAQWRALLADRTSQTPKTLVPLTPLPEDASFQEAERFQAALASDVWPACVQALQVVHATVATTVTAIVDSLGSNFHVAAPDLSSAADRLRAVRQVLDAAGPLIGTTHRLITHHAAALQTILDQLQQVISSLASTATMSDALRATPVNDQQRALYSLAHLLVALDGAGGALLHEYSEDFDGAHPLHDHTAKTMLLAGGLSGLIAYPQHRAAGLVLYSQVSSGTSHLLASALSLFSACMLLCTIEISLATLLVDGQPDHQAAFKRCTSRFGQSISASLRALAAELLFYAPQEETKSDEQVRRHEEAQLDDLLVPTFLSDEMQLPSRVIGGGEDDDEDEDEEQLDETNQIATTMFAPSVAEMQPQIDVDYLPEVQPTFNLDFSIDAPQQPTRPSSAQIASSVPSSSISSPSMISSADLFPGPPPPSIFAGPPPPPMLSAQSISAPPPPSQPEAPRPSFLSASSASASVSSPLGPPLPMAPSRAPTKLSSLGPKPAQPQRPSVSGGAPEKTKRKKRSDKKEEISKMDIEDDMEEMRAPIRQSQKEDALRPPPPSIRPSDDDVPGGGPSRSQSDRTRAVQENLDRVNAVMIQNIDKVMERGETLDDMEMKAEMLEEESKQFMKSASRLKGPGFLSRLFQSKPSAPKPKPPKKPKTKIDTVFADIENVFNGLSALLFSTTYFSRRLVGMAWPLLILYVMFISMPLLILSYLCVATFTLAILLPAVFLLLVLRTQKIERKVETGFVVRQAVLASETTTQKSLRFVNLLLRALPMLAFLVGWPIFTVYYLIPEYINRHSWIATLTIGIFLILMLVLQVLGTIRSARSFLEKSAAAHEDKVRAWSARTGIAVEQPASLPPADEDDEDAEPIKPPPTAMPPSFYADTLQSSAHLAPFRWRNVHNLIALVTLLIEAVQLLMFSVQTLDAGTMEATETTSSSSDDAGGGKFGPGLMPVLFINVASYLSSNLMYVYAYASVAVVAALLLVFLGQFFLELLRFATAPTKQEGNDIFFHSFIGSIVYGHGEVRRVSPFVSNVVALLSDTLFLIVCGKLITVFTCLSPTSTSPARLLIDQSVECWVGDHKFLAVICLIAFGYYLPLASMISPMLVEADDTVLDENGVVSKKKDVTYVQPFLSLLIVSKCVLLVASTFFGHNDAVVTVVASMIVSALLLGGTCAWVRGSQSALLRSARQWFSAGPSAAVHVAPPCAPDSVNIIRLLAFGGGMAGAVVAILAHQYPSAIGGDIKFLILLGIVIVLVVVGVVWIRASGDQLGGLPVDPPKDGGMVRILIAPSSRSSSRLGVGDLTDKPRLLPDLVRSSSEEVELAPLDSSQRVQAGHVSYATVDETDVVPVSNVASEPAASAAVPPPLLRISAATGLELIGGLWRARSILV